jgi:hypothetical protein
MGIGVTVEGSGAGFLGVGVLISRFPRTAGDVTPSGIGVTLKISTAYFQCYLTFCLPFNGRRT